MNRSSHSSAREVSLRCRGLVKRYPDVLAVDGLNLEIYAGECFGLLGPNGAGKTTTVEILEGLTAHDEGEVEVLGQRWGVQDQALRQRLGVQLQETQMAEKLTVKETLRLFRSFYDRGADLSSLIQEVGLSEKLASRVGKLSGGQKQRLALACALVGMPEVLFLDEPTTGLDPQARLRVWDIVSGLRARGTTILLTTHYMEEAERLCDRIGIMDHGHLIALGTPQELMASLQAETLITFRPRRPLPLEPLRALPGVKEVTQHAEVVTLSVSQVSQTLPTLLGCLEQNGTVADELITRRPTLEDVFVHLTGRALRNE